MTGRGMPLLPLLGATTVLASTLVPAPPALVAGLVVASEVPSLLRAATALGRRRLNGDVLEASTLLLLTARRHFAAAALLTWLRAAGEYVVARTVVTARRSLHEVIAPPDAVVPRIEDGQARPVRVPTLRNLPATAPYMHDGRFAGLDAVLDHYERLARDPSADPRLRRAPLTTAERDNLREFLLSLADGP